MTTVDDQTTAAEELDRAVCLQQRRPELPHTGRCHNCEALTTGAHCSPECREDYEKRARFSGKRS